MHKYGKLVNPNKKTKGEDYVRKYKNKNINNKYYFISYALLSNRILCFFIKRKIQYN